MITRLKTIKYSKIFIINFLISFTLFSVLFVALSEFNPFINLASKLKNEYVYTYNKNYDDLYSEEQLKETSCYYYDYEGDETILYLNQNGFNSGIPTIYSEICILLFPVSANFQMLENVRYSIDVFDVYKDGVIETKIDYINISVNYIVLDNEIGSKQECSFKIYPENDSEEIIFTDRTAWDFVSARGQDIKRSILTTQSLVGNLLMGVTLIPIVLLILSSFFFYNFEMMKEQTFIYTNYLFYKKRWKLKLHSFLELFIPTILSYTLAGFLAFFIFLQSQILLLVMPLVLMILIIFIHSAVLTNMIVNRIIERKGV